MAVVEIPVRGRFDLAQSIGFGFGQRDAADGSVLRLAFCLDGYRTQVGAAVTQAAPDLLLCDVQGEGNPSAVAAQVARVLSVDVDGTGYDELGRRDALVGAAQSRRPGLRPPLFYSAYEALLWSVLSARRPQRQMAAVRTALARAHGRVFDVAGVEQAAVPLPADLLAVTSFPGIPDAKIPRLHGVAEAALAGVLDTETLRAMDPAAAATELQRLDGIGPFYSELVTVRALGHTDVLPVNEPLVRSVVGRALGQDEPLEPARLAEVAEAWRPWRTWVAVAMRAGASA